MCDLYIQQNKNFRKCLNSYFFHLCYFRLQDISQRFYYSITRSRSHSYAIFSYRNNTPFIVSQDLTRSNSIEKKSNIQDSINWWWGKFLDKRVPALTLREEQRLITVQIKSSERCVSSKLFFTLISCLQVLFSFVFRKFLLQITKGKKRLGFSLFEGFFILFE